ncbi:transglutaminase-like domain-containing protein [Oscillochloris sp. ZM17-4]|uniref:transglutaminase-like domain-containing protein n=1 Tax=Oscillochloris sp. ZM17-4 TaxID=2866714 RepID=UPI001C72AA74|nr:transglutaminase-like domain-containing protein [Oscillochloris sp. ZM17-4]MBX0327899.1 transglutaminase-like domain-containing protein [Oscillochloris sp. ZM17-4]
MTTQTLPMRSKSLTAELTDLIPGVLLAMIMCGAVIYSLSISRWAPGLSVLIPMSLPGFFLGVIFARTRWVPGWLSHMLSALLAVVWAVQLLGAQMSPTLDTWRDRGTELLIRTIIWGRVLGGGGRGEDLLLFVAALCLLCWALAYGSAWMVFRRGWVWRSLTVNAALALINYTYVLPKPNAPFFVFLAAALLLLVHQNITHRQAQWDAQQIEYPDLLPVRFLWSAAVVCGLLILITATIPGNITVDRATRTWEALSRPFKLARERWEDAFATLNAPPGAGSGAFTARSAQLGGSRRLNDGLVMSVRSTDFDYWRAVAFDKYSDGRWQNTTGEQARATLGASTPEQARTPFDAGAPIPVGDTVRRHVVTETFTLAQDRSDGLLFVGGTARALSLPTLVEHNYLRAGTQATPNYDDTALIVTKDDLRAGKVYTVTALVSRADVQSLRAAGTDYPTWVRERYLQLPDSITARTRERAAQIIANAGARTPYDEAVAIQDYLRTFRYNESIPAPPPGAEPVDWFLFTQREGYCDYYASSMVMMLRSLGVPARWVQGYAGGVFDVERAIYEVREDVAHSWPEVYFPGFGWERFEPTPASYTALPVRPLTTEFGTDSGDVGPLASGPAPDPSRFENLDDGLDQIERGGALPAAPPPARESGISPYRVSVSEGFRESDGSP